MMKLIENPIRLNASLHKMLPMTMRHFYAQKPVKAFRLYTLGSIHVFQIEGFTSIDIVMTHDKRVIKQDAIDFVREHFFKDIPVEQIQVNHAAKDEIEADLHRKLRVKDMVILSLPVSSQIGG